MAQVSSLKTQKTIQDSTDNLDLNKMIPPVSSSNIFIQKDNYVWYGTAIKGDDGKYHLFYSYWPHGNRETKADSMNYIFNEFKGWLKYSEIGHAISDHLTGSYKQVNTVLKGNDVPKRCDRFAMHKPYITKFGNKYYLYYCSNNFNKDYTLANASAETLHWMKYNASQKIGVLVVNHISDFETEKSIRIENPIMSPDHIKAFEVTVNPAVTEGLDGKYYMVYKSRMPNVGHITTWMATAPSPIEPFKLIKAVFTNSEYACEDPTMWFDKIRKRFYAVLKNYTKGDKLTKEFGALVLMMSTYGLNWKPAKHTLVSNKQIIDEKGNVVLLDNPERPFMFIGADGHLEALFAAGRKKILETGKKVGVNNTFNAHIPLNK